MKYTFERGRRYRVAILPAGARSRVITFEGNYLGLGMTPGEHDFDCRPELGTQTIRDDSIQGTVDLGEAVYA